MILTRVVTTKTRTTMLPEKMTVILDWRVIMKVRFPVFILIPNRDEKLLIETILPHVQPCVVLAAIDRESGRGRSYVNTHLTTRRRVSTISEVSFFVP